MAIQELKVRGYRSFGEICWQPGNLNLLVGPNGSGKSNLLRLLELIAATAKGRLENALKLGGIVPLLKDYRSPSLDWTLRVDPVDNDRDRLEDALTFEVKLEHVPYTSSYQITLDSLRLTRGLEESPYWIYSRDLRGGVVYSQKSHKLLRFPEADSNEAPSHPLFPDLDPNESLLPQISDPRTNPIPTHALKMFKGWRIYHDVHVEKDSPMRSPATTQVAKLVEPDGSNLVSVLHTLYTSDRAFKKQIDEGMRAGFGDQFEELVFQPAASQQIQLAIQWRHCKQPHAAHDLSDGTLRFLFLITVLASPEPATLIAIDEPEIGLHPSMLPIVAEYAVDAASRTQVVMSSHSPIFLDAFSESDPRVTLLHWEDGDTHLFSLTYEATQEWLQKYRLGQLFTSGDLEAMASPKVDSIPDFADRLKSLPPE